MELRETIESINYKLEREFGKAFNGSPNFRVVFADDQLEMRKIEFTNEGIQLLMPEIREVPKYRQNDDYRGKFILERYVPITGETDLTVNMNYEPCWVFRDKKGNYLPPFFEGCKFVIEAIYSQIDGSAGHHVKYKDPLVSKEAREAQLQKVQNELFGNETETGDHLAYGTGVVVPENMKNVHSANNGNGEQNG